MIIQRFRKRLILVAVQATLVCTATCAQTDGRLVADGNDTGTYRLITTSGYNYEVPDNSRDHATAPFRHIGQIYDDELQAYAFAFRIHAMIDDDRGIGSITDRQRVEIKTDNSSPASMVAKEGETLTMRWKMRLPEGFKTTTKFCHLHQLKGIDNATGTADVSNPLITLTAYTSGGTQRLQLRYFDRETREISSKKTINLSEILGQWVEITETVTFGTNRKQENNGRYRITVTRMSDGKELMRWTKNTDIDLWQTDCVALRPKWGIYRSLGDNRELESILRDEEVRFADFSIEKDVASGICHIHDTLIDNNRIYDIQGRRIDTSHLGKGVYIRRGKLVVISK